MKTFRVWVTREGYYEVQAKNKESAYEVALNELPGTKFHFEHEETTDIEEVDDNG